MKTEKNPAAFDERYRETPGLEANEHDDGNEGATCCLRPESLEKSCAGVRHRWESGGKEIYEKFQANPEFALSEEYENYLLKWGISYEPQF